MPPRVKLKSEIWDGEALIVVTGGGSIPIFNNPEIVSKVIAMSMIACVFMREAFIVYLNDKKIPQ